MNNSRLAEWTRLLTILKAKTTFPPGFAAEYRVLRVTANAAYEELTQSKRSFFASQLNRLIKFLQTEEGLRIRGLCTYASTPFWFGLLYDRANKLVFEFYLWEKEVMCVVTNPSKEKKNFPVELEFALLARGLSSKGWDDLEDHLCTHANDILEKYRHMLT